MIRNLTLLAVGCLLLAVACASPFDAGQDAYRNKDYAKAYELLLPWAEKGHPEAQNYVATMLNEGNGIAQDPEAAREWFLKAAEQDLTKAQFNLGVIYAKGQGVDIDFVESYMWFMLAADRGLTQAEEGIAMCRENLNADQIEEAERRVLEWDSE